MNCSDRVLAGNVVNNSEGLGRGGDSFGATLTSSALKGVLDGSD